MCLTRNRELAFYMSEAVKEAGIAVAVNSSDASDHPLDYLNAGADYVMTGEVEETVRELARELLRGAADAREIAGLTFRDRQTGRVRINARRARIVNLDALPLPAWELADRERYRSAWRQAHGYFSVNMISSRGCPYRCNWCSKPMYGTNYQVRSARLV